MSRVHVIRGLIILSLNMQHGKKNDGAAGGEKHLFGYTSGRHPGFHGKHPHDARADNMLSVRRTGALQVRVHTLENQAMLALLQLHVLRYELLVRARRGAAPYSLATAVH